MVWSNLAWRGVHGVVCNQFVFSACLSLVYLASLIYFLVAICAVARPWESFIIGFIGGIIACMGCTMLNKLRIDDPVGCVPTHFFASVWGLVAVGLFAEKDTLENLSEDYGVFKGGSWKKLGVQLLAAVAVTAWAAPVTYILLATINRFVTLRMPLEMEVEGADKWEHGIEAESFMEGDAFMLTNGVENYARETQGSEEEHCMEHKHRPFTNYESRNNTMAFKKKLLRLKSSHNRRRHTFSHDVKSIKSRSQSVDIESGMSNETILHQVEIVSNGISDTNPCKCRELSFGELNTPQSKVEGFKNHQSKRNGDIEMRVKP